MALITCLYCGGKIYEGVKVCPKCNVSNPFDANEKATKEANRRMKQILEQREKEGLSGWIECKECGTGLNIAEVLKGRAQCNSCGFPDNFIKCASCSNKAEHYDPQQQKYTCQVHLIEPCIRCHKLVCGNQKSFNTYNVAFCQSCYLEYVTKEFISNNRIAIFWAVIVSLAILLILRGCS